MENKVFNFNLSIDWKLISLISEIDRFDSRWAPIERREWQSLKQLQYIANVRNVGSSSRIEGNQITNEEIDVLLKNNDISKLKNKDSQEIAAHFNVLNIISENYENIAITKNNIKNLHDLLMKYGAKDGRDKGKSKQQSNAAEAASAENPEQIVFQSHESDFADKDALKQLIKRYNSETEVHPLVKCAAFVYEFSGIHPFKDKSGKLSRLLSTLLLLKNGYKWIQYVSLDQELEIYKSEYEQTLQTCQTQGPNEDITAWVNLFLNSLRNVQTQLIKKLEQTGIETQLLPREKAILTIIQNYPGVKSSTIASKLDIPSPTVKRILSYLHKEEFIDKQGTGRGTVYFANEK